MRFLPAAFTMVIGVAVLAIASLAPRAGQPALVWVQGARGTDHVLAAIIALDGRPLVLTHHGGPSLAVFAAPPSLQDVFTHGLIVVDAGGASGCSSTRAVLSRFPD